MPHPYWPLFDLRVQTPRLELRWPDDDQLTELAALGVRGIHDPSWMPISGWTDGPPEEVGRTILSQTWGARARWKPDDWELRMVVIADGQVVGTQGLHAKQWVVLRSGYTGSWLGLEHQGTGLGREMRQAMLHLAFDGLGAMALHSGCWHDNLPSRRISEGLGYVWNGEQLVIRRGVADRQVDFRIDRDVWESKRRSDIRIEGLDPCLELFGIDPA